MTRSLFRPLLPALLALSLAAGPALAEAVYSLQASAVRPVGEDEL